jgi:hypothetical protein
MGPGLLKFAESIPGFGPVRGEIDNTLPWTARQAQSLLKITSFKTLKNFSFQSLFRSFGRQLTLFAAWLR